MAKMLIQDFSQEPGSFAIEFIDVTCLGPLTFASKTPKTALCQHLEREISLLLSLALRNSK